MKIALDEAKLAEKINNEIDIPYAPESTEAQVFSLGVSAATDALVDLANNLAILADYGVTVTED